MLSLEWVKLINLYIGLSLVKEDMGSVRPSSIFTVNDLAKGRALKLFLALSLVTIGLVLPIRNGVPLIGITDRQAGAVGPLAPTIASITPGDGRLTVVFTAPAGTVTGYQYSTDGATWIDRPAGESALATTMVVTAISSDGSTPLTNCVTYQIRIRALNGADQGAASATWRGVPSAYTYWLNNGLMQFGVQTNGASDASVSANPKTSINSSGGLEQGFYYNGSVWWKLSYSTYPLDLALAVGGAGTSEWNINGTVKDFGDVTLQQRVVECSGFQTVSTSGSIAKGYGTLRSIGRYTFSSGEIVELERTYTLGSGSRYLRIDETIRNVGTTAANNLRFWVGTRDDYIGPNDTNTKTRGNISESGAFSAIGSASVQAKALKVTNNTDVVYFYTTSNVGYITGLDGYGAFQGQVVNKNPATAAVTITNDGSYGMFRRFPDLSPDQSDTFTWYYVASTAAQATSTISDLSTNARPSAPTITGVTPSDSQLSIAFTPGSEGGSAITNYEYALATSTNSGSTWSAYGSWIPRSPSNTTSPLVIPGLTNGTYYKVKIRAINSEGGGAESNEQTAGIVPAPTISSIEPGTTTVTVNFTAPATTGGSAISSYQYSADGGSTWSSISGQLTSPLTISGLQEGTSYSVTIRAVNSSGAGVASTTETFTTGDQPAAPTISSISAGDRQLTIAFTNGENGGSPLTNIEYSTDGGSTWSARSPASLFSPIVISMSSGLSATDLVNGTSYSIKLRSVNIYGAGISSSAVTSTPRTVPSAPTISGAATPTSQTLEFAITAGSNGGSSITNYEYSTDRGATWRTRTDGSGSGSPISVTKLSADGTTSLTNGVEYCVQVRAVNVVGSGAASADVCATAKTVPSAPSIDSITTRDRSASVAFVLGGNGGAAITDIQYSTNNGSTWSSSGRITSPLVLSGLANGTTYTIRLRAVNSVGNSDSSSGASATVTPANVPNAPTLSSITENDSSLTVVFAPPTNDGGEAISGYQYTTDGGATWTAKSTTGTSTLELVITDLSSDGTTDLTNGTSYSIAIRAISAAGNGLTSGVLSAMPSTVPGTPTALTAVGYNTRLVIAYTAPTTTGGKAIVRYEYALASSADGTSYGSFGSWTSANTNGNTFTLMSLTNGTYYRIKVRAVNETGEGTASSEVTASPRPLAVPESPIITRILSSANDNTLSTTQLSVAFNEPANNGSAISSYQYSTDDGSTWKSRADGSGRLSPIVISTVSASTSNLLTGTQYAIRIRAVNTNGSGPASESSNGSPASDTTAPTVTLGVTSSSATSASISFTVTGNEAISCSSLSSVSGVDFDLTNISEIDSIAQTSSTLCTVNATSSAVAGGGAVSSTLTAASSFSMTDPAGNAQTTLTGSPKTISVTIAAPPDTTAPTISSLSFTSNAGGDSTYKSGEVVSVTVVFSEAVIVTGSPRMLIQGLTSKYLLYTSGSTTNQLVFSYTVASGDTDEDGIGVAANSLSLNSGTIKDAATNAATITHLAIATNPTHKVDTTAPTVTLGVTSSSATSASISFTVTGNEAIWCSSLSLVSGVDFDLTNISQIDSIAQTSSTLCTVNATSSAVAGGGAVSSTLTAASSFSLTDTAGNAQTTLTGSPKTISVTVSGSGGATPQGAVETGTTTSTTVVASTSTSSTLVATATTSTTSPRRTTTTTSPRRTTTTQLQNPTTTTLYERRFITLVPIIVTTTTTSTTVVASTTSSMPRTSTTTPSTTTTAMSRVTTSTVYQPPPVQRLQDGEIASSISARAENIWNLSLPIYVNNELPVATPELPIAFQSSNPFPVDVAVINNQAVQFETGDGFTIRVTALDENGNVAPLAPNGAVRTTSANVIYVTGEGLKPGSLAVIWIFSIPRRLGIIKVGSQGGYSSRLSISSDVEIGLHTLQVNGVVPDGNIRSMNIALDVGGGSFPQIGQGRTESFRNFDARTIAVLYSVFLVMMVSSTYLVATRKKRRKN